MDLRDEFKDVIEIDKQYIQLYFTLVHVTSAKKYFVVARPTEGEISSFEIKADEKKGWKLLSPAPKWAVQVEKELSDMIIFNNS